MDLGASRTVRCLLLEKLVDTDFAKFTEVAVTRVEMTRTTIDYLLRSFCVPTDVFMVLVVRF